MPERLLRIHFPNDPNDNPSQSTPWYWWYTKQPVFYFVYLAPPFWGVGWERRQLFPIIRILPIDRQVEHPTKPFGHVSLIEAIKTGDPDGDWGRLNFNNQHFWDLIDDNGEQNVGGPKGKPLFNDQNGLLVGRSSAGNLNSIIRAAATRWKDDWNGVATTFNLTANSTLDVNNGFHYSHAPSPFSIPLPSGPPATISGYLAEVNAWKAYPGPLPISATFNFNTFTTQAMAFVLNIGQLDPKHWNMSVFPPLETETIGNGSPSAHTKNYSGYGGSDFPIFGPQLL